MIGSSDSASRRLSLCLFAILLLGASSSAARSLHPGGARTTDTMARAAAEIGPGGGGAARGPVCSPVVMVTQGGDSGAGSLRAAIDGGAACIAIDPGLTIDLSTVGSTTLGPTALTITNPTIIEGNGAVIRRATSAPSMRLFTVAAGGSLTLSGATLRGGKAVGTAGSCGGSPVGGDGDGGAIYNAGTVALDSVTFTANQAEGGNAADCCTLLPLGLPASNGGNGRGGAVFNAPGASLSMTNCTITTNTAQGGSAGRDSSCFGGRAGDGLGGGVFSWNAVFDVRNCTIAANTVTAGQDPSAAPPGASFAPGTALGGGIFNLEFNPPAGTAAMSMAETIVSDTPAGNTDCFSNDVVTTPAPSGNLIEINQGCGTPVSSDDPHLASLGENGGSTPTMALQLPSPAVDASVAPDCLATDQRGIARPADGDSDGTAICDLGAFELEPTNCSGGCDDGNPCTADACVAGSCTHPTGPADGTSCDDADACSGPDVCSGGTCDGPPLGGQPCSTGQPGACAAGTTECTGGIVTCVPDTTGSSEVCDGLDNDCDGTVDDGNPGGGASCSTGQPGPCSAGTTVCTAGSLRCVPNTAGIPEVCDNLDNDCNGTADDGNPGGGADCNTGQMGVCAAGTTQCAGGFIVCHSDTQAGTEVCSNSLDDDCDGSVDENTPDPCLSPCGALPFFDDFTDPALSACWSFHDLVGDASVSLPDGEHLVVSAPEGVRHDCWTGGPNCPRVLRDVPNVDAVYETKIDGDVISRSNQDYGIILMQNDQNYLRFIFWSPGVWGVHVRAYRVIGNTGISSPAVTTSSPIQLGASNSLRVTRAGSLFTLAYKIDDGPWIDVGTFVQNGFNVRKVGFFVNNAVTNPAVTGRADYVSGSLLGPNHTLMIIQEPSGAPNPVLSGGTATFGVGVFDSLGHAVHHMWSVSCPAPLSNGSLDDPSAASPRWTAPLNTTGAPKDCEVRVVVNDDGGGLTTSDTFLQTVLPAPHDIVVTSAPVGSPNPVASGGVATLGVMANDTAGHPLTFLWSADCDPGLGSDGSFSSASAQFPTWTAPSNATGSTKPCTISVRIDDGNGLVVTPSFTENVLPVVCGALPVNDPFSGPLDGCWSFVNPAGGSRAIVADHLELSVPSGSPHDCWNQSPNCARLVRAVPNTDTIYETRIDGVNLRSANQDYGILLFQNATNYLRFEFWTMGSGVYVRAYKVINGSGVLPPSISTASPVPLGANNRLRVTRAGNVYTLAYKIDGGAWTTVGSLTQSNFTVNLAGLFANNAVGNPLTTGKFDSFSAIAPGGPADMTPPVRSNGQPTNTLPSGTILATLSLTTNENATCRYGNVAGTPFASLTPFPMTGSLMHLAQVPVADGNSYTFYVRCQDALGNTNQSDFTIAFAVASASGAFPFQDPFTGSAVPGWTFFNPAGGTQGVVSDHLELSVPSGSSHDCWNTSANCARLLRPFPNQDAVYETTIDGLNLSARNQDYGIMLFQDPVNYLRFEFWTGGAGVFVRAYKVLNGSGVLPQALSTISPVVLGSSNSLRVTKDGNVYTLAYKIDGGAWTTVGSFTEAGITVTKAGLFVNNAISNPATTGRFDVFSATSVTSRSAGSHWKGRWSR